MAFLAGTLLGLGLGVLGGLAVVVSAVPRLNW